MVKCSKRQREISGGQEQHRCIHREAETFRELVVLETCQACPLQQLRQASAKKPCVPCGSSKPQYINVFEEGWSPCPFRVFSSDQPPKCSVTGLEVNHEICGRCDEEAREKTAAWGDKLINFSLAVKRWVASGCPTRTEKEVASIYEDHCSKCEQFDGKSCKACGCSIGLGDNPLGNKLKMATEHCPLGRF